MSWTPRGNIKGATGAQGPTNPVISGRATGSAVGTSLTAVSGMSISVPAGTWFIDCEVYLVNSGTTPSCTLTLVSSGGLVASPISYDIMRATATANAGENKTAFNSASQSLSAGIFWRVVGRIVVTTPGILSVSMTRTGGTSTTVVPGSFISAVPSA